MKEKVLKSNNNKHHKRMNSVRQKKATLQGVFDKNLNRANGFIRCEPFWGAKLSKSIALLLSID